MPWCVRNPETPPNTLLYSVPMLILYKRSSGPIYMRLKSSPCPAYSCNWFKPTQPSLPLLQMTTGCCFVDERAGRSFSLEKRKEFPLGVLMRSA
ncbi:hypothetical protein FKM82_019437 [Ascaphus truei]